MFRRAEARFDRVDNTLERIEKKLNSIVTKGEQQVANWADIKKEVQETKDASQAIMTVLGNVRKQLADLIAATKDGEFVPLAEIQAVHDDLDKNELDMVAATLEGTDTPTDPHAAGM
jgi:septal ring factor EnvC (AmiA/AmiB activator)